jgi:hypothetical protein
MFVGGSEEAIARAFREAAEAGAMLVIDDAVHDDVRASRRPHGKRCKKSRYFLPRWQWAILQLRQFVPAATLRTNQASIQPKRKSPDRAAHAIGESLCMALWRYQPSSRFSELTTASLLVKYDFKLWIGHDPASLRLPESRVLCVRCQFQISTDPPYVNLNPHRRCHDLPPDFVAIGTRPSGAALWRRQTRHPDRMRCGTAAASSETPMQGSFPTPTDVVL